MCINKCLKLMGGCWITVVTALLLAATPCFAIQTQVTSVLGSNAIKIGGGTSIGIESGDIMVVQRSGQKVALELS